MAVIKVTMNAINKVLNVPSLDPDDARRRKLLNVILFSMGAMVVLLLLVTFAPPVANILQGENRLSIVRIVTSSLTLTIVITYLINRYGPSWVASSLFLLLFTGLIALFDEPENLITGRSMLLFCIPILMASNILPPYAGFAMALVASLAHALIGAQIGWLPNPFAIATFFVFALVSWLASNTLERALKDLRILNLELDQRVRDRTRDLSESLNKTEAILDSTADGIIVFDTENKAIVANPAIANLLGRPAHGIAGYTLDALIGGEMAPADREKIAQLLADRAHTHDLRLQWGRKVFSTSLAPVHDNSGRVTGTVAVFRDFTREAEIDRMKSAFISIASHELRTPLSAILGYIDMLQAGVYGELTDQQLNVVGRIAANTGQLLGLANNLLDRAQLEVGKLSLRISSLSPSELVNSAYGVMEVIAQAKGLKLTSQIASDVPTTLSGDRQRLHQILVNLVSNAIKFTDEGYVETHIYMYDANHWALAITDTGHGIAPEAQSYIFDAFRQADDLASREYGGAGLGLSIVKQLVTLMGGEIRLESEVGRGSTFTVILPLVPPAQSEETALDTARQSIPVQEKEKTQ